MQIYTQILIAILLGIKRNWQIFFGLIAGVAVGILMPSQTYPMVHKILEFIGQAFIGIIQMVVIPLVISAIVIGIVSVGDNKMLAKFGKKMVLYYGIISVAAVSIGAALALIVKPGLSAKMFIDANVASHLQEVVSATEKGVLLKLSNCSMQIAGENIRVEKLSPEEKILILVGKVFEVKYSSATAKTSFFKKMFR